MESLGSQRSRMMVPGQYQRMSRSCQPLRPNRGRDRQPEAQTDFLDLAAKWTKLAADLEAAHALGGWPRARWPNLGIVAVKNSEAIDGSL